MQHGTSSRIILYFPIYLRRKMAHALLAAARASKTEANPASCARASVPSTEPAAAAMSLTGEPMPEFFVKVLPADGTAPKRVSASSLVHGTPTVIHFYNSG